jgi:hypothetical protein
MISRSACPLPILRWRRLFVNRALGAQVAPAAKAGAEFVSSSEALMEKRSG